MYKLAIKTKSKSTAIYAICANKLDLNKLLDKEIIFSLKLAVRHSEVGIDKIESRAGLEFLLVALEQKQRS